MNEVKDEGLWNVEDTARFLKLRPYTVRAMVRQQRLPAFRIGRLMRFDPVVVRNWVRK